MKLMWARGVIVCVASLMVSGVQAGKKAKFMSNLNYSDGKGNNILHRAILSGNAVGLSESMQQCCPEKRIELLRQKNNQGATPLLMAAHLRFINYEKDGQMIAMRTCNKSALLEILLSNISALDCFDEQGLKKDEDKTKERSQKMLYKQLCLLGHNDRTALGAAIDSFLFFSNDPVQANREFDAIKTILRFGSRVSSAILAHVYTSGLSQSSENKINQGLNLIQQVRLIALLKKYTCSLSDSIEEEQYQAGIALALIKQYISQSDNVSYGTLFNQLDTFITPFVMPKKEIADIKQDFNWYKSYVTVDDMVFERSTSPEGIREKTIQNLIELRLGSYIDANTVSDVRDFMRQITLLRYIYRANTIKKTWTK